MLDEKEEEEFEIFVADDPIYDYDDPEIEAQYGEVVELDPLGEEEKEEKEKPEKKKRATRSVRSTRTIEVRSLWLTLMNGVVLVRGDNAKHKLMNETTWQFSKAFTMKADEFDSLPDPDDFGDMLNETVLIALWKAGIVDKNHIYVNAVQRVCNAHGQNLNKILEILRS